MIKRIFVLNETFCIKVSFNKAPKQVLQLARGEYRDSSQLSGLLRKTAKRLAHSYSLRLVDFSTV